MARRQAADYDLKREGILAVAARLFAQRGFSESSVSDLAAACDMSKSLLYHYYSSKEEILYAVMSAHLEALEGVLEEIVGPSSDLSQAFELVIRRFLDSYAGASDHQKVLLNQLANLPPDKRSIIVGKQRKIVDTVQSMVVALYPKTALEPGRARAQTMLIFGMINWTHNWMNSKGPLKTEDIAEMVLDLVVPERAAAQRS